MAQITGQAGVNLTQELAAYLNSQQGNLTSEQLSTIINQYTGKVVWQLETLKSFLKDTFA